jgi:hypothetical protein
VRNPLRVPEGRLIERGILVDLSTSSDVNEAPGPAGTPGTSARIKRLGDPSGGSTRVARKGY